MIVRGAQPEDIPGILKLCDLLAEENSLLQMKPEYVRGMVNSAVLRVPFERFSVPPTIGVIGDLGSPVAMIAVKLSQMWYSDEWLLEELFNFVHPDHRAAKLGYVNQLIDYGKGLADQLSIQLLIGILSNIRTAAKVRLYKKRLPEAGAYFVYPGKEQK